jgi:hypothetical protein
MMHVNQEMFTIHRKGLGERKYHRLALALVLLFCCNGYEDEEEKEKNIHLFHILIHSHLLFVSASDW